MNSSLEGDRRTYQQDPANRREGVREALLDVEEGADIVMVKPAMGYLDVVQAVRAAVDVPVAAYNVSGEYSMVEAAAANGWIDRDAAVLEVLTSIRRAGADVILTYWALDAARMLRTPRAVSARCPPVRGFETLAGARSSTTAVFAVRREVTVTTGGRAASEASDRETRPRASTPSPQVVEQRAKRAVRRDQGPVRRSHDVRGFETLAGARSSTTGGLAVRREVTAPTGGRAASEASGQTRPERRTPQPPVVEQRAKRAVRRDQSAVRRNHRWSSSERSERSDETRAPYVKRSPQPHLQPEEVIHIFEHSI